MIKVLIIAYWYPPLNVIGSVRALKLSRYFPEYDITPVVFTTETGTFEKSDFYDPGMEIPNITVYRTKTLDTSQLLKTIIGFFLPGSVGSMKKSAAVGQSRMSRIYHNIFSLPDTQLGWCLLSRRKLLKICRKENIQLIISTAPPFSGHLLASYIRKKTGIPWIADFRDLWSNSNLNYAKSGLFARIDRRLEVSSIRRSDKIVSVTAPYARLLSDLHNRDVTVITNGFDEDDYADTVSKDRRFSIVYTGIMYPKFRDPHLLFIALRELLDAEDLEESAVDISFYGRRLEYVHDLMVQYGLEKCVSLHGYLPSAEIKKKQMAAQVLLMIDWMGDSPESQGVGAKIYEYLGAGSTILCLGKYRGAVAEILEETNTGFFVTTAGEVKEAILSLYRDYRKHGATPYAPDAEAVKKYTYREVAGRFAALIHRMVSDRSSNTQ
ncbi:MAG: glycosyltransferase [Deltaproteobacteria bacterium]|nr:glycosyltransferase [Candidatus Zymogenaceae bacterium]